MKVWTIYLVKKIILKEVLFLIEKVHEDRFGTIIYTGLTKDLEIIKSDEIYLSNKTSGSKFYNIEDLSNSLIWNQEDKEWIKYDGRESNGAGGDNNNEKTYTDEEVNKAIDNVLTNFLNKGGIKVGISLEQLTNSVNKVMTKVKDKFVSKEEGKGLSTNDYSTEDKSKVAKIDDIENSVKNVSSQIAEKANEKDLQVQKGKNR